MRLTLRTLLAWLDDTLPANEVRAIGQQVHESTVARELVERIHKVTRRRRLTVPHTIGPDATDPNVVAEYLDNTLANDAVQEFETRCLKSDVHLAEIASVHQILSLLGQRAKVPPEARNRMYHLIKGREVARHDQPRAFATPRPEPGNTPPWEPVARPRSGMERFGPAALVLGLVALLAWSTWQSLTPTPVEDTLRGSNIAAGPPAPAPPAVARPGDQSAAPAEPPDARPDRAPGNDSGPGLAGSAPDVAEGPAEVEVEPGETNSTTPPAPAIPSAEAANHLVDAEGITLRRETPEAEWERANPQTRLRAGDVIVGLDPYRNALELGVGRVTLVKDTAIRLRPPRPDSAARLDLLEGRLVLQGVTPERPYAVGLGELVLEITPPPGAMVGVERVNRLVEGQPKPASPVLIVHAAGGPVELGSTGGSETLADSESIRFTAPGNFFDRAKDPTPAWVTETTPTPLDAEAGKQFARFFRDGTSPLTSLVEATVDERPEMRRFAIEALGTIGEVPLVVGALNTEGAEHSGQVRRAAVHAMRQILARGGEPAAKLREELVRVNGSEDWADQVEKLLAGYTLAEAMEESTQAKLVELLGHQDVGVRELALMDLMTISNRGDDLGYDPEDPEGDGIKQWRDLLKRGAIRQAPNRP